MKVECGHRAGAEGTAGDLTVAMLGDSTCF